MGINWFTVIAQIINFLVLVWLLKRFLYKPVLKAIADRENSVTARLSEAESKRSEAEKEKEEFEQKNVAFDRQRETALKQVQEEAKTEKQKLLQQAREEFQTMRTNLQESLQEEQTHINRELRQRTIKEVFAIAGKALSDLASASLEEQTVNMFLTRLQSLAPEEQQQFTRAVSSPDSTVTIRSAFDLPADLRSGLEQAIRKLSAQELLFVYQVQSQLISGLELHVQNYKLSWNVEDYLDALKKQVSYSAADLQNITSHATI